EPGDGYAQRLAAVEPIEEERAGNAGERRRRRVASSHHADPGGGDAQGAGEKWPQRHDHHEIEDVDELDRANQQDDGALTRMRLAHWIPDAGKGPGDSQPGRLQGKRATISWKRGRVRRDSRSGSWSKQEA